MLSRIILFVSTHDTVMVGQGQRIYETSSCANVQGRRQEYLEKNLCFLACYKFVCLFFFQYKQILLVNSTNCCKQRTPMSFSKLAELYCSCFAFDLMSTSMGVAPSSSLLVSNSPKRTTYLKLQINWLILFQRSFSSSRSRFKYACGVGLM